MGKKTKNAKIKTIENIEKENNENIILKPHRSSDEIEARKEKWINKQRVLVFAARGISHRDRHLMKDIKTLMPHHRVESKMERSKTLSIVNEICVMKHCNKCVLFEGRRKRDLYMWLADVVEGLSVKFLIENIHTMGELKLTGNCLRGSRPLLSFDSKFDSLPHLKLIKELLTQIFGVPFHHPKSQPFVDHVYTFTYLDKRIWFRNFQVLSEDGGLSEIGPRFVLNPVKLFEGSFTGNPLWENPDYVSPSKHRQILKKVAKNKYVNRLEQKVTREARTPKNAYEYDELDDIFENKDPITLAGIINEKSKKKDAKKAKLLEKIKDKQNNIIKNIKINKKKKEETAH
ncbi:ribosome biogenesis protein BRX1 homolog [Condylostylus longicornis]|uniref:ribosome biogenesis protein BRX1 homolog n=1 Tax=Condylostylus longicornis TaxID=2530218 RepID=UPI00244DA81D|nr:ribosome biogenesis protein BRX1 homolog [Condylostylus longicornis]